MNGHELTVAGEDLVLRPEKALYWPRAGTLFIADLHLGKADAFRANGIALPSGPDETTLARLNNLLSATAARRLIILGDLLHHPAGVSEAMLDRLRTWRERNGELAVELVLGNHDLYAGTPPDDLAITPHDTLELPPFLATHHPAGEQFAIPGELAPCGTAADPDTVDLFDTPDLRLRLAGHVHPAIRLGGRKRGAFRAPCFLLQERQLILPAFGEFTGTMMVRPEDGDRVFVVGEGQVMEWPGVRV